MKHSAELRHFGLDAYTQQYFARPRLMMRVVPTASATAASSWLAIPNIGQMVLMFPVQMKYTHARTMMTVDRMLPGSQSVRASGFQTRPPNS